MNNYFRTSYRLLKDRTSWLSSDLCSSIFLPEYTIFIGYYDESIASSF